MPCRCARAQIPPRAGEGGPGACAFFGKGDYSASIARAASSSERVMPNFASASLFT